MYTSGTLELPQRRELLGARRVGGLQIVDDLQVPARRLTDLVDRDARVQRGLRQLRGV
jgi:hypothetical protein